MNFPKKRFLLSFIFAIFLVMSITSAAFASGTTKLITPAEGTTANFSYAPNYFNWSQSNQDTHFVLSLSANGSIIYVAEEDYSAGSSVHTFYLPQSLKDSLPRNTTISVGVTTFHPTQFGGIEVSATSNAKFVVTN